MVSGGGVKGCEAPEIASLRWLYPGKTLIKMQNNAKSLCCCTSFEIQMQFLRWTKIIFSVNFGKLYLVSKAACARFCSSYVSPFSAVITQQKRSVSGLADRPSGSEESSSHESKEGEQSTPEAPLMSIGRSSEGPNKMRRIDEIEEEYKENQPPKGKVLRHTFIYSKS